MNRTEKSRVSKQKQEQQRTDGWEDVFSRLELGALGCRREGGKEGEK